MTTRETLHHMIDELPDDALPAVAHLVQSLRSAGDDRLPRVLADAPWDDEPQSAEEREALKEAYATVARGAIVADEDLDRELGR